ncbi:MAG: hypothetical protein CUN55_04870 [Phototrophicales bacterium]|nr:MAG: hypothetical protein CUN55_04870 [Phototrophicales bacterium]
MTLSIPNHQTYTIYWAVIGLVVGLSIVTLPNIMSLLLIGTISLGIFFLLEPTLAFVVLLFIAPMKTLLETELAINFPLDVGQLSFVVAIGVWGIRRLHLKKRFPTPFQIPIFNAVLFFLATTLLTIPNAISVGAAINEWLKWVEILVLIYVLNDQRLIRWQWLVIALILVGVSQAIVGIYQFQGGSGAPHLWILDHQYFRAFGTFGQPNPFGAFMGLILPLSLGVSWGLFITAWQQRTFSNIVLAIGSFSASGILLLGLLVSWSRGAWIGFAAASLAMLWVLPSKRWQGTMLIIGTIILGSILYSSGQLPSQISDRVLNFTEDFTGFRDVRGAPINDDNYAVVERLAHWQSALAMATDHLWLGVGFGNYEAAYKDYALINWPEALGHAHNYYLNLLAETGILGLSAYLIMWGLIFSATYRPISMTSGWQRGIIIGLVGVWVHLAVHSLVDKLYVNNIFLHIGVLFGVLGILHNRSKQAEEI